jgi:hypothetical protein
MSLSLCKTLFVVRSFGVVQPQNYRHVSLLCLMLALEHLGARFIEIDLLAVPI